MKIRIIESVIGFNRNNSNIVRSLAVKRKDVVKVATRFMSVNLLMFARVSIGSFTYNVRDAFCFSDDKFNESYNQNKIIKCFVPLPLTGTDSTFFQFVTKCDKSCWISNEERRKLIFQIFLLSKLRDRLDRPHEFFL